MILATLLATSARSRFGSEQPLTDAIRHGPQPLVTDAFAVDPRHAVVYMAHDAVHGYLVAAFATDRFKCVPQRVEVQAVMTAASRLGSVAIAIRLGPALSHLHQQLGELLADRAVTHLGPRLAVLRDERQ